MKVRVIALFAALLLTIVSTSAQARVYHHRHYSHRAVHAVSLTTGACEYNNDGRTVCGGVIQRVVRPVHGRTDYAIRTSTPPSEWSGSERVVGGRHAGDPHAFCGAEAARYVFGETKRDLWPAAAWIAKYARTSPAPGMAAARSHHVMILMSHVSGSDWMVHDGNSGHGLTREHVRSIAGYVIVDPHSPRYASR